MKTILKSDSIVWPEKQLVIDVFIGIVTLHNFKAHKLKQAAQANFSSTYNILCDLRNAELHMSIEDVFDYAGFIKAHPDLIEKRKAAIVLETPNQFIYTQTYKKSLQDVGMGQDLQIFFCFNDAVSWLNLNETKNEIIDKIDRCRKKPAFSWDIEEAS